MKKVIEVDVLGDGTPFDTLRGIAGNAYRPDIAESAKLHVSVLAHDVGKAKMTIVVCGPDAIAIAGTEKTESELKQKGLSAGSNLKTSDGRSLYD